MQQGVNIQNTQRTHTTQHQKTIQLEKWQIDIFPKTPTDGQQAHEKMLKITNQGNANQNHNEISPYTCQKGYHKKKNPPNKCWW